MFIQKKSDEKKLCVIPLSTQMISSLFNGLIFIVRSKSLFFIESKTSKS